MYKKSTHTYTHTERDWGVASKQKLNFVSRLKLKIALVVRVNSKGSPVGVCWGGVWQPKMMASVEAGLLLSCIVVATAGQGGGVQ